MWVRRKEGRKEGRKGERKVTSLGEALGEGLGVNVVGGGEGERVGVLKEIW